ncbi:Dicer-like protein 2 [Exophiala xenobiotica]|nr:Dicer-like protein 2 [Exophiala xenobiotica]KAK5336646.1 Dicer-like protein 2 [Exophiala xenobiotica]
MDLVSEDSWSDSEPDACDQASLPLHSRAYQIEMFEQSMQGNIIAIMGTGSGKTLVAKLRIEAELQRSIGQRVWFTAPSVVLAIQQYSFLSKQLPAFQFKLITGMDNAEYWKSQEIWDKVLFNIDVVVSTPRILLDALNYGFMSLKDISLLVVDEAHHCVARSDLNTIMQLHYHAPDARGLGDRLPHILGLSASPITKRRTSEIRDLEANLDAKCKTPLQQLDEYTAFVNMPDLETIAFDRNCRSPSMLLTTLRGVISTVQVEHDPFFRVLKNKSDMHSREKMQKILKRNATPAIEELRAFDRSCGDIHEDLGRWACDAFIAAGTQKALVLASAEGNAYALGGPSNDKSRFIGSILQDFRESSEPVCPDWAVDSNLSPKAEALFNSLIQEYSPTLRGLIFVKKRDTAWALTELINNHSTMHNYQAFSFVGASNPGHQGVFDFAQLRVQNEHLEKFRRGEFNLCVATSVLEEGIDVPAMNLVICFDERPNLRSFVQSRGRARQHNSKFVIFRPKEETGAKLKMWETLEREMKEECEDSLRALEELKAIQMQDESGGEIFPFLFQLPKKEGLVPELAYCIEGEVGVALSAKVYLPSSLPGELRIFQSKSNWITEKMAKKDAAYHAYLSLYRAGLVTDNLLPPEVSKATNNGSQPDGTSSKEDGMCDVHDQYDPWSPVLSDWSHSTELYAHSFQIAGGNSVYPSMLMLLPVKLFATSFPIYLTADSSIQVSLNAGKEVSEVSVELLRDISFHLLMSILGRRLGGIQKEQLPFLLVPDLDPRFLEQWYSQASTNISLASLLADGGLQKRKYLLRHRVEPLPYIYDHELTQSDIMDMDAPKSISITARRFPKRLEYLDPPLHLPSTKATSSTTLLADNCEILGLPAEYGELLMLVPSITHMVEVALRSAEACKGPLSSLEFADLNLVSQAFTLPSVNTRNYERLEFLGDDLLKFYASLQTFVDNPYHPESLLSIERDRIVNNARLQRTTRELGLDRYLTKHKFSGAHWRAGVNNADTVEALPSTKKLSAKTLADIVEALIGAAKLDGAASGTADETVIRALQLFLGEVEWRSTEDNLARLTIKHESSLPGLNLLAPVETLIGYTFTHRSLLSEALTHSSLGAGTTSYERLEFLGDAILDHIVKTKLFHSPLKLEPEQMTFRRHALVSHVTLAFFVLQASHERSIIEIQTDFRTRKTEEHTAVQTVLLLDYIKRIGSRQDVESRELTVAALGEVRESILESFHHGRKFPWSELYRLRAPKSYSDIIESILAAVFIDSGGSIDTCESVLDKLGFMKLLDRFANERDLDVLHPEARLFEVAKDSVLVASQSERSGWRCKVVLDGEKIAHARKAACKDEATCRAAEKGVDVLLSEERKRNRGSEPPLGGDSSTAAAGQEEVMPMDVDVTLERKRKRFESGHRDIDTELTEAFA